MEMPLTEWLSGPSPQRAICHALDDLPGVEGWLKDGIHIADDEELVNSLADFTGAEFLTDSPPLNVMPIHVLPEQDTSDNMPEPVPQRSGSSDPSSSTDGPMSSGAVCGGTSGGGLTRMSAIRSFSTNDLPLLEAQLGMFPSMVGLSAPHPYGSHMGSAGFKAKTMPALESVPEGAPSQTCAAWQGGPVPIPSSLPIPSGAISGGGYGSASPSPALGTSPAAAPVVERNGAVGCPAATAASAAPSQLSGSPTPPGIGGGLRAVPSTGTLSALMDNTLQFQRESSDGSAQHQAMQQPLAQAPAQGHLFMAQSQVKEPQQAVQRQSAPAVHDTAGGQHQQMDQRAQLQRQHQEHLQAQQRLNQQMLLAGPAGTCGAPAAAAGYDSAAAASAAAAATAAAATGVYPVHIPGHQPRGMPAGLAQFPNPFGGAAQALHSMPAQLSSACSLPAGGYVGLPLPLPAQLLAYPPQPSTAVGAEETNVGCAGAARPGDHPSGAAEAAGNGDHGDAPRLRKSQSALELRSWRTSSMSPEADAFEEQGMVTVGQKLIGRLTPEERLQRILRYRHKRNIRNFNREIKYQCRKTLADSRPRVGGRFARNDDPNSVLPHQTKKAMRVKSAAPAAGAAAGGAAAAGSPRGQRQRQQAQQRQGQQETALKVECPDVPSQGAGGLPLATTAEQQEQPGAQLRAEVDVPQQQALLQRSVSNVQGVTGQRAHQTGPSSSTTTTVSTNSSDAAAVETSPPSAAATAAQAAAAQDSYALKQAPPPPHRPSAFLPAAGNAQPSSLPDVQPAMPTAAATQRAAGMPTLMTPGGIMYSYAMSALPYHPPQMYPPQGYLTAAGLVMPLATAAGLPPPGALPPGLDPAQLHHHYAMVSAAAQAAARGVYAHLGLAQNPHAAAATIAAATAMPLHNSGAAPPALHTHGYPAFQGFPYGSGVPAVAMPAPSLATAPVMASASTALTERAPSGCGGGGVPDTPPRFSTPLLDELLTHMDSDLIPAPDAEPYMAAASHADHPHHTPAVEAAASVTCMAVDG